MPRKLTSRQYKRGGLLNAEKEFYFMMSRPCPTASHERPEARTHGGPELAKSGHMADKERTHGGHTRGKHKRGTRREGSHMGRHMRARLEADTWRTRFGGTAKADSRRTHGGQSAETRPKRNQGGHKANNGGPGHIAASLFSPKREPHYTSIDPKQFLQLYQQTPNSFSSIECACKGRIW